MYKLEADFQPHEDGLKGPLKVYKVEDICNPLLCLTLMVTIKDGSTHYENFQYLNPVRWYRDDGQETKINRAVKAFVDTYYQGYKRSRAYAWVE